jgi:hypothetical protein
MHLIAERAFSIAKIARVTRAMADTTDDFGPASGSFMPRFIADAALESGAVRPLSHLALLVV